MARDWRKVALAVVTAAALASVCPQTAQVQAQQARKAPAAAKPAAKGDPDGAEKTAKKRQDPAEAQRAVENASKLLQSGKADQAEQVLSATLAAGSLPPAIMARALHLRGMAYRQQKKPAQAISDLTSALWLKGGLSAEDRAEALKQRSAAFADAGLTETGGIAAAGPAVAAGSPATKESVPERPASKSWGTVTTPSPEGSSGSRQTSQAGGNWFNNWFNAWGSQGAQASSSTSTASISKDEPGPERVTRAASVARVSTAWSSNTEIKPAAAAAPAHATATAPGKYRVQLAAVRTHREAQALAGKAKAALGAIAREPEIDQTVLGNMGSFYRVRVGPFSTAQEAQAVCVKIKGTGFDCLTVTQ